ncbi:hypothetical protein BpHYR1_046148 [Brachionus plicatilis]|uniref:Uncharacterized protein n=1 Tax=Brachionus plicatilis TaxID=10195 RepID=A0A3M7R2R5_BRAPC|nr:hypothetical protein BpHYR1_046148 [Brachionus plicatilis]
MFERKKILLITRNTLNKKYAAQQQNIPCHFQKNDGNKRNLKKKDRLIFDKSFSTKLKLGTIVEFDSSKINLSKLICRYQINYLGFKIFRIIFIY